MAKQASLDFSKVQEGGGQFRKVHYPPGDYPGKVLKVQDAKAKESGDPMWLFTIQVKAGKYPYYCKLNDEKQLWKIRNLLVAAGVRVPKKRVKVNPQVVVGKTIGVTLDEDEYQGKMQGEVAAVFPTSELQEGDLQDEENDEEEDEEETEDEGETADSASDDDEEEEEEEEQPAPKRRKKTKPAAEDVEDDELEELDIEDI